MVRTTLRAFTINCKEARGRGGGVAGPGATATTRDRRDAAGTYLRQQAGILGGRGRRERGLERHALVVAHDDALHTCARRGSWGGGGEGGCAPSPRRGHAQPQCRALPRTTVRSNALDGVFHFGRLRCAVVWGGAGWVVGSWASGIGELRIYQRRPGRCCRRRRDEDAEGGTCLVASTTTPTAQPLPAPSCRFLLRPGNATPAGATCRTTADAHTSLLGGEVATAPARKRNGS